MSYPHYDLDDWSDEALEQELLRRRTKRAEGKCDYCNYPLGSRLPAFPGNAYHPPHDGAESCKHRDRHFYGITDRVVER